MALTSIDNLEFFLTRNPFLIFYFLFRYSGVWLISRCGVLKTRGFALSDWYSCLGCLILTGILSRVIAFFCLITFQSKWVHFPAWLSLTHMEELSSGKNGWCRKFELPCSKKMKNTVQVNWFAVIVSAPAQWYLVLVFSWSHHILFWFSIYFKLLVF